MSYLTYHECEDDAVKPLAWLHGEIKTPPFSRVARIEAGELLRRLQRGETLTMPQSRPMPVIGARCHELRIRDDAVAWRLIYRLDSDAVIIAEVFAKKTETTPDAIVAVCKRRLRDHDDAVKESES